MEEFATTYKLPAELNQAIIAAVKSSFTDAKQTFESKEQYPHYLNKKEACSYLNVSYNTLMGWIKNDPDFPYKEINGVVRFSRDKLDEFMEKSK